MVPLTDKKLAVLEFAVAPGVKLQASEQLADDCRGAVVDATRRENLLVITRENMNEIIKLTGGRCEEGQCEVETARNLGVDYFLTGNISAIDGKMYLSIKAYETRSGKLLGQKRNSADREGALLDLVRPTTNDLLHDAFGIARARGQRAARGVQQGQFEDRGVEVEEDAADDVVVAFESEPAGAAVRLDGALLCQSTPCSKRIASGSHEVIFEKERYAPATQNATAMKGITVRAALAPLFGIVVVETEPPGLPVQFDFGPAGPAPVRREVDAGPVEVVAEDRCFVRVGERLNVVAGEERTVRLAPKPRMAGLKIMARDASGNDVDGEVYVDGTAVGAVGDQVRVPVCGKRVHVVSTSGRWGAALELIGGNVTSLEAVVDPNAEPESVDVEPPQQPWSSDAAVSPSTEAPATAGAAGVAPGEDASEDAAAALELARRRAIDEKLSRMSADRVLTGLAVSGTGALIGLGGLAWIAGAATAGELGKRDYIGLTSYAPTRLTEGGVVALSGAALLAAGVWAVVTPPPEAETIAGYDRSGPLSPSRGSEPTLTSDAELLTLGAKRPRAYTSDGSSDDGGSDDGGSDDGGSDDGSVNGTSTSGTARHAPRRLRANDEDSSSNRAHSSGEVDEFRSRLPGASGPTGVREPRRSSTPTPNRPEPRLRLTPSAPVLRAPVPAPRPQPPKPTLAQPTATKEDKKPSSSKPTLSLPTPKKEDKKPSSSSSSSKPAKKPKRK